MPTLFFMRHAESEANKAKYLASQTDVPITEEGAKAAEKIAAEFFNDFSIDTIYASPQLRARQTAAPFSTHGGMDVNIDPAISEQHLGRFTGMTYNEALIDPYFESDRTKRWDWEPEGGGESYRMLASRITPFFKRFEMLYNGSNFLIVSHAVTLRIIKGLLENTLPLYPEKIANNGEIWQVEFRGLGQKHVIKSHFYGNSASMVHQP
ncbi:MAG: histidine phosphatase family protein [Spirochaetales bacterium]|nr:histidine phosphatase family protein [Spirochaetales bacterium]